jgi:hypothetical protein
VLESAGGEQAGVVASYCISNTRLGCGVCVDGILLPNESFTVAHPGDELTIAMPEARLTANPRCTPACSLAATITPAQCYQGRLSPPSFSGADDAVQSTLIVEDEPWALTVAPGLYFLQVTGGEYVAADGWSGDANGTFGLLVDPEGERGVVDGAPFYAACRASYSADAGSDSGVAEPDGGLTSE